MTPEIPAWQIWASFGIIAGIGALIFWDLKLLFDVRERAKRKAMDERDRKS